MRYYEAHAIILRLLEEMPKGVLDSVEMKMGWDHLRYPPYNPTEEDITLVIVADEGKRHYETAFYDTAGKVLADLTRDYGRRRR